MSFISLGLSQELLTNISKQNFTKPYPIQQKTIPEIIKGKDILGIAKTGSGKTAAYVLPILNNLQTSKVSLNRHVKVLVLVPTRELAIQVDEVFKIFSFGLQKTIKSMAVFGGVSINPQMKALQSVQILVATPGRLLELVNLNAVHISKISTLVLDEADKMLNLGFKEEVNRIIALLPKKRQNLLFSTTLSSDLKTMHQVLLNNPLVIKIEEEKDTFDLIKQSAYFVSDEKKGPLLRYLIKSKNMAQVLVFTSSVKRADRVADKLRSNGVDAEAIHSKKSQGARTNLLTKFKHDKLRVLVATDLISRGIDIDFLPYVINYELPRSPKEFIHRIGRTGRAEKKGEAISLIAPDDQHHFKIIQKKMGKWVDMINSDNIDLNGF